MFRRLRAWLGPRVEPAPEPAPDHAKPEGSGAAELEQLRTSVQKVARAQAKLSLRLDEVVERLADNHRELLARLDTRAPEPSDETPTDLLDALDRLDEAARSLGAEHLALGEGLAGIAARLERELARQGIVRHAGVGEVPDGRRVRIVGTEPRDDLPDGVITRVVRAAATRGDRLIREGEVLINEQSPT